MTYELRKKIADVIEGRIELRELYYWFMDEFQDEDNDSVNLLRLRFAEFTSGHWKESDMMDHLEEMYGS